MGGAIPPFPNTSSWRGARLRKAHGQLYLYLTIKSMHYTFQKALKGK